MDDLSKAGENRCSLNQIYMNEYGRNMTIFNSSSDTVTISTPLYLYVWITVANVLIFLIGFTGNTLVISIVYKFREMRTITNLCLVNLSISDILVLAICQTSALTEFYAHDRWLYGDTLCKLIPFLEVLVTHASILIMLGISYGRYFAVCYPLENYSSCTRTRAFIMMASAWILAALSAFPFILMSHTESATFTNDNTEVSICRTHISKLWQKIFIVLSFVLFFVIPFFVLSFVYSRTIYTVISESKKTENVNNISKKTSMKSRQQLVVMLLMIVVIFFLCVLPMRIVILWILFSDPSTMVALGLEGYLNIIWSARVLQYTNSAVNPLIYNMFSVKFKKAFSRLLFCGKRQQRLLSLSAGSRTNGRYTYTFVKKNSKETGFC